MGCRIHVFKKPRGFILILKFGNKFSSPIANEIAGFCTNAKRLMESQISLAVQLTALSAVCTTLTFSTKVEFSVPCNKEHDKTVYVSVRHPYKELKLEDLDPHWKDLKCDNDEELKIMSNIKLPFDYSSTESFFATCAFLSMSFSVAILLLSMLCDLKASKVKKVLVIEFKFTSAVTLVWLALSSAWAQGALDLVHYLHPENLFKFLSICIINEEEHLLFRKCKIVEDGSYDVLYASVILGFANFLLWLCSLWFIYKEIISSPQPETGTDISKGVEKSKLKTKTSSDDASNDHADVDEDIIPAMGDLFD